MAEDSIEDIRRNIVEDIKEKIKKNPKYAHPCNKERQEDMKRLMFESGYEFTTWMVQNNILKNSIDIFCNEPKETIENTGCNNTTYYYNETNTCDKIIRVGFSWVRHGKDFHGKAYKDYKNGDWTGKWTCRECYDKYNPNSHANTIKFMRDSRTGSLDPNCNKSEGNRTHKLVRELYGWIDLDEENDNYNYPIDFLDENGKSYQVQGRRYSSKYGYWPFGNFMKEWHKEYEDIICICKSDDGKIIERIYKFPPDVVKGRKGINIVKNYLRKNSKTLYWYEQYRVKDSEELKRANDIWMKILEERTNKDRCNIEDWQKWKKFNYQMKEFYQELEKKYGKEFVDWARENKNKVPNKWINVGCKTDKEYQNKKAQDAGFKDHAERVKIRRWNKGEYSPMSENKECSSYFSDITERIFKEFLLTIFEYVEKMNYGNIGFDFICKNPRQEFIGKYPQFKLERNREYKIQLKSRCLQYVGNRIGLNFTGIDYNGVTDYFILSGWDNRESLVPLYVWMIHKDDIIRGEKFWNRECFYITINPHYLGQFRRYELDELDELKKLCAKYHDENSE